VLADRVEPFAWAVAGLKWASSRGEGHKKCRGEVGVMAGVNAMKVTKFVSATDAWIPDDLATNIVTFRLLHPGEGGGR